MSYQNIYIDNEEDGKVVYVWDDVKGLRSYPEKDFRYAYVPDPKGKYLSMTGKKLSKTYRFIRGHKDVFESDLPMETRVLTDLYLKDDEPSTGNVVLFFDIEVSMENGVPNVHTPNNEVTSIAMMDSVTKQYTVLVLDKKQLYEDRESESTNIIFCDSEETLLRMFINVYEEIAPTIITGWNSNRFDVPYLYNRIRQVCGPDVANRLSPIGKVKYSDRLERYKIAGVSSLDYLELYRKFTYTQQPNYRLDTIGRIEVNMGKVEYEGSLDKLFAENLETFIEYNLQDVRIIVALDEKRKLIELVRRICHIGHVPYEDYNMSSRFLEGTIVTYLHRKNIIVTNKPVDEEDPNDKDVDDDDEDDSFIGAYVKEPIPGLYDWVYSLDLESLYPSIIMSLNISPETKVGYVRNYNIEQHIKKEIIAYVVQEIGRDTTVELSHSEFMEFLEDNGLVVSGNGILYTTDKRGVIPEILDVWFKLRKEYKNTMITYANEGNSEMEAYYDQLQHVQKIFLNSMYGYLGLVGARFYDVDNASAVTLTGQDVIKSSAKYLNKRYEKILGNSHDYCVYVDTDSLYFPAAPLLKDGEDALQTTIKIAYEFEEELNKFYSTFANRAFNCTEHRFRIKGESIAIKGLWLAKKRYVLDKVYDLEKNGPTSKLVFKGLDVVRSSFPKTFREFMKQMFKDILAGSPKDKIDSDILTLKGKMESANYIDIARNTSANNISKFILDKSFATKKGTPAHIKAAISYNKLIKYYKLENKYAPINDGEKIKFVYLKKNPLRVDSMAMRGYQDPQEILDLINEYIDYDTIFDKELKNKLEHVYDALGWGRLPTQVNQNLSEFFTF